MLKRRCRIGFAIRVFVCFCSIGSIYAQASSSPKYVFLFIGDGMASVQIQAAEAYLQEKQQNTAGKYEPTGKPKAKLLNMTKMPVCGMASTYAADRFITDSASAGTAMACGIKARDGVISQKIDGTNAVTIAELAKTSGMKVGIISSVSIDHATPAVFYAHEASRNHYHRIALQLTKSGFDFFGGGGFLKPVDPANKTEPDVLAAARKQGYTIVASRESLTAIKPGTKIIAYNGVLDSSSALYYDIDRKSASSTSTDHLSLAEFTGQGLRLLEDHPKGFFMMVEGGKIDWACHANDARTAIDDTLAFDEAVGVAVKFYEKHPHETLIVVTGDHECGGMTIGFAGTGYDNYFFKLKKQTCSFDRFNCEIYKNYKSSHPWRGETDNIDADLKSLIRESFGLDYDNLSGYQKARLETAYDRSRKGNPVANEEEDRLLYGGYDALSVTVTHLLNQSAGIAFNSYAHTGVPVAVHAVGNGSERFSGFYDNTDIAKKLAGVMRVTLKN